MARLPTPGADDGSWGDILNDFLKVEHNTDGSLRASGTIAGTVKNSGNESIDGVKTFTSSPVVPTPSNPTDAANKDYVDTTASAGTPDATGSVKGKIKLTNDLGGTADLPTVPGLAGKVNASTVTTKGDVLAATASATLARLGVGSNYQYLKADSAATTGLKWVDGKR